MITCNTTYYTLVSRGRGKWAELRDPQGELVAINLSKRDVQLIEAGRRIGEQNATGRKQSYQDLPRIRPCKGGGEQ